MIALHEILHLGWPFAAVLVVAIAASTAVYLTRLGIKGMEP